MPALSITLNELAAALLGAGAYIYASQRGQWKAVSSFGGQRIERSSPDPYAALGAVAQVLIDYEAQQAAQDLAATPAARAAYKAAWAASKGQPVPQRFAAAEAAAAATETNCARCKGTGRLHGYIYPFEPERELTSVSCPDCYGTGKRQDKHAADWPSTIRTEQDNARTMQRLYAITGRSSAAPAAEAASNDEQPAEEDLSGWCHQYGCANRCRRGEGELCEECRREQEEEAEEAAQEELAQHNTRFDWWESLTDAEREAQIKFALR